MNEQEMREADVPWPKTEEELLEYLRMLAKHKNDYGTCVYAMSMAATATFYYMSNIVGATGFQASCADLDFIRRTRHMEGPFMLTDLHDYLYPQYNLHERLDRFIDENKKWLKEEAQKKLEKSTPAHPNVEARWRELANAKI